MVREVPDPDEAQDEHAHDDRLSPDELLPGLHFFLPREAPIEAVQIAYAFDSGLPLAFRSATQRSRRAVSAFDQPFG